MAFDRLCNGFCGWDAVSKAQGFTITIDPAFPPFQLIATTDSNLTTITFTLVKIEKDVARLQQ